MPIRFSELLSDTSLEIKTRRDIKKLYEEMKRAVAEKKVTLEGHSLPTTMNAWIGQVEGKGKLLKNDSDVVDFSLAEDAKLERWLAAQRARGGADPVRSVYVSEKTRELFERVKELDSANQTSMSMTNGKKDDVLGALSDLQASVALFLQSYDRVREGLRLPNRELPLDKVKVRNRAARQSA